MAELLTRRERIAVAVVGIATVVIAAVCGAVIIDSVGRFLP